MVGCVYYSGGVRDVVAWFLLSIPGTYFIISPIMDLSSHRRKWQLGFV